MEICGNLRYERNREFTLMLSVNSRLFDACIHACTESELTLVRSVKSCPRIQRIFLNHVISRDQNISCNHSPLPRPGCD